MLFRFLKNHCFCSTKFSKENATESWLVGLCRRWGYSLVNEVSDSGAAGKGWVRFVCLSKGEIDCRSLRSISIMI